MQITMKVHEDDPIDIKGTENYIIISVYGVEHALTIEFPRGKLVAALDLRLQGDWTDELLEARSDLKVSIDSLGKLKGKLEELSELADGLEEDLGTLNKIDTILHTIPKEKIL
jgi:hypothetical protein